jgi:saccharopine dehydrogenase (NAD+, L-lysine-forming)
MSKVLIIGAGGVGGVVTHKCAQVPEVFSDITLASRTLSRCQAIQRQVREMRGREIAVEKVDADDVAQTVKLIRKV